MLVKENGFIRFVIDIWIYIFFCSVFLFPLDFSLIFFCHSSGRVLSRFIPIDMILKPVLNEHLTPFTCYWRLALMVRGKEELVLAFKVKFFILVVTYSLSFSPTKFY